MKKKRNNPALVINRTDDTLCRIVKQDLTRLPRGFPEFTVTLSDRTSWLVRSSSWFQVDFPEKIIWLRGNNKALDHRTIANVDTDARWNELQEVVAAINAKFEKTRNTKTAKDPASTFVNGLIQGAQERLRDNTDNIKTLQGIINKDTIRIKTLTDENLAIQKFLKLHGIRP